MENQNKLNQLLIKIANNGVGATLSSEVASFNDIYQDDFRHAYSELARIVLDLEPERRDYLSEGFEIIRENIEKLDLIPQAKSGFLKLYDHVNLEIIRVQHFMKQSDHKKDIDDQIEQLNNIKRSISKDLDVLKKNEENINNKINAIDDSFKKSNTQALAILSVFTAILMGFTGGFTLLGSAFTSLATADIFNVILVSLVVGMILFDAIFMILQISAKIYQVEIRSVCINSGDCPSKSITGHEKCNVFKRLQNRYPLFFMVNAILILLFIIVGMAYFADNNMEPILDTFVRINERDKLV